MKYHSPFSIIIISLAVLLVFASVALFAVFSIGMTSPTLITAERMMDGLRSIDSGVSVSFDSMDRSFSGGFTLRGFSVSMDGSEIVSLDEVRIRMGLGALLRYLAFGSGTIEIEGRGGSVSLPAIAGGAASTGGPLSLPEGHSADIRIFDVSLDVLGVSSDDAEMAFHLEKDGRVRAELSVPLLRYSAPGIAASIDGVGARLTVDDGITLSIAAASASAGFEQGSARIESPIARIDASSLDSLKDAYAAISFSSAEGSYADSSISVGRASASGSLDDIEVVLLSPRAASGEASASADEADISIRGSAISVIASRLTASYGSSIVYGSDLSEASYDLDSGAFSIAIPYAYSDALSLLDSGFRLEIGSLSVSGSAGEGKSISADGRISISADGSALSGTGGSLSLRASEGEDGLSAVLSLSDLRIPGIDESAYLYARYSDGEARIRGSFGEHLRLYGDYGDGVSMRMFYSELPLKPFLPLVSAYAPVLYNYIGDSTSATGSASVEFSSTFTGPMDFAIALSDLEFNDRPFSIAASGNGVLEENGIRIDQVSATTDFIRASFEGSVSFETNLPEGRFVISMTDSGYELFVATLTLESDEEYYFSAEIPRFSSSWLRGRVNWSDENRIESSATLKSGECFYPFGITIDFLENRISLENERANAVVLFGDDVEGTLSFDRFELPVFTETEGDPSYLEGTISSSFSFSQQQFRISSDGFVLGSIGLFPDRPDLVFSMYGDNETLSFPDISFTSPDFTPFSGRLEVVFGTPSFAFKLDSDDSETLLVSLVRASDGMFTGLLRADRLNLGRFGVDGMTGDINLTARAGTWDALSFSGSIRSHSRDMINDPSSLEADMYVDSDEIVLSSISYIGERLSLSSEEIRFSSQTGLLTAELSIDTAIDRADAPLPVSGEARLTARLRSGENLADAIEAMYRGTLSGSSISLELSPIDLGGMFDIGERSLEIIIGEEGFEASGSLASGFVDALSGSFSLFFDLDPVARFSVDGSFGEESELSFSIDSFEISVADLFLNPTVTFLSPSPAHGELLAVSDGAEWNISGWLAADEVAFEVFWMPGERVILHNPYFAVWENSFDSLIDDCTVLDLETYERTPGRVALSIDLSTTLSLAGWAVDVYAEDDSWIGIRLPLTSSNVDIWGDVTGYLRVEESSDGVLDLSGDLDARDLTMSLGMEPIPEWYGGDSTTTSDLTLLLTENVKFVFPLTGDPILRADLAENQNLRVRVDEKGSMDISGSLDIRSGELFYFQKNFYITEGNISFRPDPFLSSGVFNPIINLRARLRDFDSDGNAVDIYLILRDSTLSNISPSFESSPSKPISEIMQILGQSILPNSVYGDLSVSSMVSIVSASVDILSRIGLISSQNDDTLEQSIRSSLALDTFSLHTNIIENLIFDTVSYAASNIENDVLSPMARYLDGTTLYLGKYLSPELYLEGMVHLDAEKSWTETKHTFLADDLNLDIEISLEWDNPLALFTIFTQPQNITLYDFLDSFGFGVSKRIVW